MTPPRNQDRAGDDELVAPVIALPRRGPWDAAAPARGRRRRSTRSSTPRRPRADSRRAQHLGRSPDPAPPAPAAAGAFGSRRTPARASEAGATQAARHAATARGRGRSRAARSRRRDRVARRRPLTPSPRPVATDNHRHLGCGRDGRGSSFRAGARIQPSDGRGPSAPGWRALAAPLARAPARQNECAASCRRAA